MTSTLAALNLPIRLQRDMPRAQVPIGHGTVQPGSRALPMDVSSRPARCLAVDLCRPARQRWPAVEVDGWDILSLRGSKIRVKHTWRKARG